MCKFTTLEEVFAWADEQATHATDATTKLKAEAASAAELRNARKAAVDAARRALEQAGRSAITALLETDRSTTVR